MIQIIKSVFNDYKKGNFKATGRHWLMLPLSFSLSYLITKTDTISNIGIVCIVTVMSYSIGLLIELSQENRTEYNYTQKHYFERSKDIFVTVLAGFLGAILYVLIF